MAKWQERFSIAGKTALITGASSGIGLEIGRMLMEQGANVMLADMVPDRLKAAKAELARQYIC